MSFYCVCEIASFTLYCYAASGVLFAAIEDPYEPLHWEMARIGCYPVPSEKEPA